MNSNETSSLSYTTGSAISKDGTTIGYRQLGEGPAILLIHGGMMAAQNFMTLGTLLADEFTVYIPDRRGRGLSGPAGENYSLIKECEDVEALLIKTNAHAVFGLSSGAIIALQSACLFTAIHKVALYEPPLPVNGTKPSAWASRYNKELTEGNLAAAMVSVIKGTADGWFAAVLPRFILTALFKLAIKSEAKEIKTGDVSISKLIPTMYYDAKIVKEMEGKFDSFKKLKCEVLLLGGSRSKTFLKIALAALKKILPHSHLIQLPGVGHTASDNGGKPQLVARELKLFFKTK